MNTARPRRITVAAIAILCAVGASAQTEGVPEVSGITSALRGKRYEQAHELAGRALAKSPQDARLLTLDGIALSGLGRDRDALEVFHRALRVSPSYIAALEGAAQVAFRIHDDSAKETLDQLLHLRPDEPTAHAMRAMIACREKDCATAVVHFEKSGTAIDRQPAALSGYGVCLVSLERAADGARVFERLVALRPSDAQARQSLAASRLLAGQPRDAVTALQPLLDGDPAQQVLDLAASAYEAAGDTPSAVALLRKAIVNSPGKESLYAHFASIAFTHKSYQVGIDMLTAGLKRIPDSAELHLARGVLYVQLAQYDNADADFAAAERMDPSRADAAAARALAQFQNSDLNTALATVESQLKGDPRDPFPYYLLAELLSRKGATPGTADFGRAISAAQHAVQLKPNFAMARDVLSRLYLQKGDLDLAIEQCRLALRDDSSDATALYRLIRTLQKKGTRESRREIPALLKQFTELRGRLQNQEEEESRYRLIESTERR